MLALLMASSSARAATCTVSATAVSFVDYDRLSSPLDSFGSVVVTCTGGVSILGAVITENVSYSILLSTGSSGSYTSRSMQAQAGANMLQYNLYSEANYTTIWGDGINAGTGVVSGGFSLRGTGGLLGVLATPETEHLSHPVYGRIPAGQNVPAGIYEDTITVTVNY